MAKISVCIPTYNRVNLLPQAIESVLAQTYQDWELIICDDGSQDGTVEFMAAYKDKRIKYVRHPENIGKSNNMRSGFNAATGTYFIKFDDDDRLTPKFLAKTVAILESNSELDFVGTDHWIINEEGIRDDKATQLNSQQWGRTNLKEGMVEDLLSVVFVKQSFQVGATLFRREVLVEVDFMRPDWQSCEDNDLLVRLALAGKKAYYLPELLMEYRFHSEQGGIDRAIPYLRDKLRYLNSYQFESERLEQVREKRLGETQQILGVRLIEQGDSLKGRELIQQSLNTLGNSSKATLGLILSYFPLGLQQFALLVFRRIRSQDYARKVRQS